MQVSAEAPNLKNASMSICTDDEASAGPFAKDIRTANRKAKVTAAKQPAPTTARNADANPAGGSEGSSVAVPLSHPRYEKKTRMNRHMSVTDGGGSSMTDTHNNSVNSDTGRSPAALLSMRSSEQLHVRQGPLTHKEAIRYQAFACYRHGRHQVHTQSVGYSSDGDLVLHRTDVNAIGAGNQSATSASTTPVMRYHDAAVCLKPGAKPEHVDIDPSVPQTRKLERQLKGARKYPGVRCPKNRKVRNRLINDHFASPATRRLWNAAAEDSDPEGVKQPAEPTFEQLPEALAWITDVDEATQVERMKKYGVDMDRFGVWGTTLRATAPPPRDAASFRFAQLSARLKSELRHAMSTDFMPSFIAELEVKIEDLITKDAQSAERDDASNPPPPSFTLQCRDGYGRLITHAVASYYKVVSTSDTNAAGQRVTKVSLPRRRVPLPEQGLSSFLCGERPVASDDEDLVPSRRTTERQVVAAAAEDVAAEEKAQAQVLQRRRRFKRRVLRRQKSDFLPGASTSSRRSNSPLMPPAAVPSRGDVRDDV